MYFFNPELQLKKTDFAIENKLKNLLNELRGNKFVKILVLQLKKKKSEDETKYSTFYSKSKAETYSTDINSVIQFIYSMIMTKMGPSLNYIRRKGG